MPTTEDSIFYGALSLRQHRRGYRFTEDAVILGAFAANGGAAETVVDLGAGCGVIGLTLLHRGVASRLVAIELQPGLAQLARYNVVCNGFGERSLVMRADLRCTPLQTGTIDLAVANPPYTPADQGHLPKDRERALARHEVCCTPRALVLEASRLLKPDGRLAMIYPTHRLPDVHLALSEAGFFLRRSQHVQPGRGLPPTHVLVEALRSGSGAETEHEEMAPLVTRGASGERTELMESILAGRWSC